MVRRTVADRWFVEIVIDTGQRYQTIDLNREVARREADDMRSRVRVISVTMIQAETGEAITEPSRNLMACGTRRCWSTVPTVIAREALAEALGGA